MVDALRRYVAGAAPVAEGTADTEATPRIAFVVPGQGAQWVGMGRELLTHEPAFRTALERCDQAAGPFIDWSIIEQLQAEPDGPGYLLDRIDVIQPVLVALAIAYAELLQSLGIAPHAVVGHSMGEVGAACIAGALDLDQAMRVICLRSALMRRVSGAGAMALVDLPIDEVRARLVGLRDQVSVAASNSPRSSVISGTPPAVQQVMAALAGQDVFCRLVKVDVASHSAQMDPLAVLLEAGLAGMQPASARIPIYSTLRGRSADGEAFDAGYWASNLRQPVLFSQAVTRMAADGITIFVELGPHPILLSSVQQTAPEVTTIACGRREEPEQASLLSVIGGLWSGGYAIDWHRVMPEGGRMVRLPLYPWQRERYWAEAAELRPANARPGGVRLPSDDESRHWLYRLAWQPSAVSAAARRHAMRWLVVADDATLGAAVVQALQRSGAVADMIPWSRLDAGDRGSLPGPQHGIIALAGDNADAAFLPLRLLQWCLASPSACPRLWFVTRGAQAVADGERVSVDQAALWGAARVVAEEHPDLWGGLIDLDPAADPAANASLLVEQGLRDDGEDQLAFRQNGCRHVLRLVQLDRDPTVTGQSWRPDSAYLVTGGLGGVGLQVARAMAEQGARRLILLGRTALPPREQWSRAAADSMIGLRIAAVRGLEAMGVAVHTPAVDVGDEAALRRFLDSYAAEGWPPIRGVIHAAVALNNGLAGAMGRARFDSVLQAKLRAAQALDRLLPDLDVFVTVLVHRRFPAASGRGELCRGECRARCPCAGPPCPRPAGAEHCLGTVGQCRSRFGRGRRARGRRNGAPGNSGHSYRAGCCLVLLAVPPLRDDRRGHADRLVALPSGASRTPPGTDA